MKKSKTPKENPFNKNLSEDVWRKAVTDGKTSLGYGSWVAHQTYRGPLDPIAELSGNSCMIVGPEEVGHFFANCFSVPLLIQFLVWKDADAGEYSVHECTEQDLYELLCDEDTDFAGFRLRRLEVHVFWDTDSEEADADRHTCSASKAYVDIALPCKDLLNSINSAIAELPLIKAGKLDQEGSSIDSW